MHPLNDSWDRLNVKCAMGQEFVIAGYVPSKAQAKAIGALALGF
jgi:ATP-dependent DNA ligase